ncbi:phosphotransferase [Leisingera sp. S132]|uniref:phosphotransferase enzyme family protein n=1 Tax=Leisingera sp. S132 TaxID=2867016 RepID=UPI0021A51843|nr:phosphotransferase [Leisingera sp. S132]UWQ79878.1 phosphotransferase [Leisingera sp. S132]
MTTAAVTASLSLWGMQGAQTRLIATRENQVYRVDHAGRAYALRLHRPGYRTDAELWSELQWMNAAAEGGLHVPAPIPSASGAFLHVADGIQVDVLTWLSGAPIGQTGADLDTADRNALFYGIGREMARLHAVSDRWTLPEGFSRWSWDREGLLGEDPLWGRFWENPSMTKEDRALFLALRSEANAELQRLEGNLDYGLIHADLVRENVMAEGDKLQLIDFDDSGFGFRLFDLATTLLKNMRETDYPALRDALIAGYMSVRVIDLGALDLFILLRSATYAGWIINRMDEPGSKVRNQRFIGTARVLARQYLARKGMRCSV